MTAVVSKVAAVRIALGEGVARRGGLQRVSEARPMEVRSDRTPQPELERRDRPRIPPK